MHDFEKTAAQAAKTAKMFSDAMTNPVFPGFIWMGKHGISEGWEFFVLERLALAWLEASPHNRRLWQVDVSNPEEWVLVPAAPAKLKVKHENE